MSPQYIGARRSSTVITYSILLYLSEHAGCKKTDLAHAVSLNGEQVSSYLDCMQPQGLVETAESQYSLSDKGRRAMACLAEFFSIIGMEVPPRSEGEAK